MECDLESRLKLASALSNLSDQSAKPISNEVLSVAKVFLPLMNTLVDIYPTIDGALQFEWDGDDAYREINIVSEEKASLYFENQERLAFKFIKVNKITEVEADLFGFLGPKGSFTENLNKIVDVCGEDGWDGYDSKAIHPAIVDIAFFLAPFFNEDVKLVAIPNGTIAFVYDTKRPYSFLEIIGVDQINIWSD